MGSILLRAESMRRTDWTSFLNLYFYVVLKNLLPQKVANHMPSLQAGL